MCTAVDCPNLSFLRIGHYLGLLRRDLPRTWGRASINGPQRPMGKRTFTYQICDPSRVFYEENIT